MCGIYGYYGFRENALLERMSTILRHRGPDDCGTFVDETLSMGMRRLSIIDLEGGRQPVFNEDHSLALCFNGEIYNYIELTEELTQSGHEFSTHSDTEVIVHAYEQWGLDFLNRLNGMFAFALYDTRNQELILARDRAGQKPLYYCHQNSHFIFASEIKAILESDGVERIPNPAAIDSYLGLRYTPQPITFFQGIHVLPAAHVLRFKHGQATLHRYWDVPLGPVDPRPPEALVDELEALFLDCVRLTMRSDVPVGAYLSAGVDSSLIVAAMMRYTDRINTYSLGFHSPVDETPQARALATHLGTNHHEVYCTPEDFSLLPKVIWHMDRPMGEPLIVAYYKLAEAASRDLKVVLAGEGADELFAGYPFHKVILLTERYHRLLPFAPLRRLFTRLLNAAPTAALNLFFNYPAFLGDKGKQRTVDFLSRYADRTLAENYVALRSLFDRDDRDDLYTDAYRSRATDDWIHQARSEDAPFLDRLLELQFDDWLQDYALLRQDKNTMAHSMELRLPFLDHRLIEFAFRLPREAKINGLKDKFIEREMARRFLPTDNAKRNKQAFYLPIEFFQGHPDLDDLVHLTLDEDRVRKRGYFRPEAVRHLKTQMDSGEFLYVKQVMSLVILELWHMLFIDKTLSP